MMKKLVLIVLSVVFCVTLYSQKSSKVFVSNFYDAVAYMYEDNYGAALEHWKKAEDKDPDNPNVWYNMGVCYKNSSKDRFLAVEYLTKSLDYANPNYVVNDHTERTCPIDCYLELGIALRMVGKYDESLAMLERSKEVSSSNGRNDLVARAEVEIETSNNAKKMTMQKSCTKTDVANVGDVINTEYSDHSPIITCDGNTLYFTSKRPNSLNSSDDEKIYMAKRKSNGEWSSPELLPNTINSKNYNESVVSVSSDGKQLYFFRSGSSLQGNLYVSEMNDKGSWGKPKQLNSDINTKYRESHIAVAPDGNSMYFTSDRPGGFGGLDIYVVKKLPNGKWSEPQLLPEEVNTPNDEEYPFVHPNGSILYFNSKGHESTGGYDVFYSRINDDGTFSKAESMCSPINTPDNDICYSLSCDGKTAYVAGIREDSYGEYDIYVIEDKSEPNMIVYKGSVKYADNAIPKEVTVWVKDKTTGEDLGSYNVDENGEYYCYLMPNDNYSITYSKNGETLKEIEKTPTKEEGESFKRIGAPMSLEDVILPLMSKDAEIALHDNEELTSDVTSVLDDVLKTNDEMKEESRQMIVNLEFDENKLPKDSPKMQKVIDYLAKSVNSDDISYNNRPTDKNVYNIKVSATNEVYVDNGKNEPEPTEPSNITYSDTLELRNIYFDFDKYDIKSQYTKNLDELVDYMKDNPGAKIQINGHTDDVGSDEYNMALSGRRAMAVKNYLVDRGVKQDKVEIKKYGESSPIASNGSNSTRKYNRRIEFKVLEQGSERYLKVVSENNTSASNDNAKNANVNDGEKVYRVQLFALSSKKDVESFNIPNLKVREVNGKYKYYLGDFSSREEANEVLGGLGDKYPNAIVLESSK
ncbi:MAG: PD40 domain-containing protein [Bacteroidales bacterium]|nr:PD40 domain-containing protein [Bacteroidales bacterium]